MTTDRIEQSAPDVRECGPIAGGAPDAETAYLMQRLSNLQTWCVLMMRKDNGGVPAADLIQETRAFIVDRLYPRSAALRAKGPGHE